MSGMAEALSSAVRSVAKDWKKAKIAAGRSERVSHYRLASMRSYSNRVTIREVAFEVMEAAYQKASGDGRYPANARQIYYAARPAILAKADADSLDSQYFTQTLLKEYMERRRPGWDVVFDARGHFTEPHTEETIGLGGIEVRNYIAGFNQVIEEKPELDISRRVEATSPGLRYGGVLFIEKEGFDPILKAAKIAERFDLAITSTKGMPVSAACDLLGGLARTVYVLHDFDKAGFSMVRALRRGTRGSRGHAANVVDLGLRLADIEGLEREPVTYSQEVDPTCNLRESGATQEEIDVLVHDAGCKTWDGERVELNAMMSDEFLAWLEEKLVAHGVAKLQPADDVLAAAYRRARYVMEVETRLQALREELEGNTIEVPGDLADSVRALLVEHPTLSWDEAVYRIADDQQGDEDEEDEEAEGAKPTAKRDIGMVRTNDTSIFDQRVTIPKAAKRIIVARVEAGEAVAQVAADYGVTRQRIEQIVKQAKARAKKLGGEA